MLHENRMNLNVPSLAIYSTDYIKLGGMEPLEALKLTFRLGSMPLFGV